MLHAIAVVRSVLVVGIPYNDDAVVTLTPAHCPH